MYREYSTRGGKVIWIEIDNTFKPICDKFSLKEVSLITCDPDCYVPRAKCSIQEVKDQICWARMLMLYKHLPKKMLI